MKRIFAILFLALAMLLSACGAATATPESSDSISSVYTAAAATLAAQAPLSTPTPIATLTPSPTLLASVTLIPSTTATLFQSSNTGSVSSSSSVCDNSAFLSDITIPDGTILAPGQSFTKTWSLSNTGTCTWSTSYTLDFFSGDVMSGSAVALSAAVASGGSATVSISMVAPTTAGTYTGYWKLKNASGAAFGQAVYVQIVVSSSAASLTPTSTSTSEVSATSTITATTESASTSTLTLAPSSTPQPSQTSMPTESPAPSETPGT